MTKIVPTLTDFSSGFISKRMRGRVDNALLIKGAKEMLNCYSDEFGSVRKRGGLEHKVYSVCDGEAGLIKWSINKDVDLIIVFSENSIKFLDVSDGSDPQFLKKEDPSNPGTYIDYEVTELPVGDAGQVFDFDLPTETIQELDYAQNLRELIIVHKDIKPIRLEFFNTEDVVGGGKTIEMSVGFMEFSGNIASTKEIVEKTPLRELGWQEIKDATRGILESGVTYPVTDGKVDVGGALLDITSITCVLNVGSPSYTNVVNTNGRYDLNIGYGIYNALSSNPGRELYIGRGWHKSHTGLFDGPTEYKIKDVYVQTSAVETWEQILEKMATKLVSGSEYIIRTDSNNSSSRKRDAKLYFYYNPFSYTITLTVSGSSNIVLNGLEDSVYARIKVDYPLTTPTASIDLSGYKSVSSDVMSRLSPWMDTEVEYKCMTGEDYLVDGIEASSAVKVVENGVTKIIVSLNALDPNDEDPTLTLTDSDGAFTGRLGIILTPFYESEKGDLPSAVAFHAGRLFLANRNIVYASKVNEYQNFAFFEDVEFESTQVLPSSEWPDADTITYDTVTDSVQQTVAASAMKLKLATDEDETVQWMLSVKGLHIGTSTSEWFMTEGLDATNVQVLISGRSGSANQKPRFCDNRVLFVSADKRQLFAIDPQSPTGSISMTDHAQDIFDADIVSFDFRQYPSSELFVVLSNGKALRGRLSQHGIYGWSQIVTRSGDTIKSVAVVFARDEDAVYFLVNRFGNGVYENNIERLYSDDSYSFSGRRYLDGGIFSTGALNDLAWLYGVPLEIHFNTPGGELSGTCAVLVTNNIMQYTPYGETIAVDIPTDYTEAYLGIKYDMAFETQNIDTSETEGLGKSMGKLYLRLLETGECFLRSPDGTENKIRLALPSGNDYTPFTGSVRHDILSSGGETPDKTVRLVSHKGEPFTMQSIRAVITISEAM